MVLSRAAGILLTALFLLGIAFVLFKGFPE